ncbi:MAG: hypothetical protein ACLQDV_25520 [Candidatus Binataceae bacterium]
MKSKSSRTTLPNGVSEEDLQDKSLEIANDLGGLGRRIERGDETDLLIWVIPRTLACSHRPLRHHRIYGGSGRNLTPDAMPLLFEWTTKIRESGIKSIICLMHDKELAYYSSLDLGAPDLIAFYASQGFEVRRIKWEDPAHSKAPRIMIQKQLSEVRTLVLEAFDTVPKPALLHCSAGIDRSSPVAAFLAVHRGAKLNT